jgi:hypothetical protein
MVAYAPPPGDERVNGVRRLPIVVALLCAAVIAIAAGDADPEPAPPRAAATTAAAVAAPGTQSSAWYCGGMPDSIGLERQTVAIANIGDATSVVTVVYPTDGSPPVRATQDIPARSVTSVPRSSLGPAGGVVVESFSRDVIVEAGVDVPEQLALAPCATTSARTWYFAAGTTVRGVEQWLVLFNPLGRDAKVDVTLRTDEGIVGREQLRALDVPRRGRVLVDLHSYAVRRPRVAVEVRATTGRVVAEQVSVFSDASGPAGVAQSLGAVTTAGGWLFAGGSTIGGAQTTVAIANPGLIATDADVNVVPAGGDPVEPATVSVPPAGVVWVRLGACEGASDQEPCIAIPPGSDFTTVVESANPDTPIVAEQLARFSDASVAIGDLTLPGTRDPARRWLFARSRVADERSAVLTLAVPGIRPVVVDVALVHDGQVEHPPALQDVEVAPGPPTALDLGAAASADAAVVVRASGPIVADETLYGANDVTRSAGVPVPD